MTVRTAVVGLGSVAPEHLEKLKWIPEVEVVAVCDLSQRLADAFADRHRVPAAFDDYPAMLAEAAPDVVHVLSPPQTHVQLVTAALEAGAHVLVEKPIAPTWEDYVRMRDGARAAGKLLVENYNYRFGRAMRTALEVVDSGRIGDPVVADAEMSVGLARAGGPYADADVPHFAHALPGGALLNFASHPASVLVPVIGEVLDVRATARRLAAPGPSEDELRAVVAGSRGAGTLTLTSSAEPAALSLRVRGTSGVVEADAFKQTVIVTHGRDGLARAAGDLRRGLRQISQTAATVSRVLTARQDYFEGLRTLLERFYGAVRGEGPPPVSVADMDGVNRLVHLLFDEDRRL